MTGSVIDQIVAWLDAEAPHLARCFDGPAAQSAIDAAGEALAAPLPADFVALARAHDGQRFVTRTPTHGSLAPFITAFQWTPLSASASEHRSMMTDWDDMDGIEAIGPVRPLYRNRKWWPFTCIYGSSCYHAIDLDPAPGGVIGQVIVFDAKSDSRRVIAPSVTAFFQRVLAALPAAEITDEGLELADDDLAALGA